MTRQFFIEPPRPNEDAVYARLRDGEDQYGVRKQIEEAWDVYRDICPDENCREKAQDDCVAMVWQMMFSVFLVRAGYKLKLSERKSVGPDICIDGNPRVWIECVAPTRGEPGHPERVPEPIFGVVHDVPENQMILRITSVLLDKRCQIEGWLNSEVLQPSDVVLVAICGWRFGLDALEAKISLAEKAVFGIGDQQLVINLASHKVEDDYFLPKDTVKKNRKTNGDAIGISTRAFLSDEYEMISGLIWAPLWELGQGETVATIRNAFARAPFPDRFFHFGQESNLIPHGNGKYTLVRQPQRPSW